MTCTDAMPGTTEQPPASTSPPSSAPAQRPDEVPEKFWDAEAGSLRVESLLKSYQELERKLTSVTQTGEVEPSEATRTRWLELLGRPTDPASYAISAPSELLPADPALNARLHEAGFTQQQAQLVYDLAGEYLLPALGEAVGEVEAAKQIDRLERQFGGTECWRATAQQIKSWASAHLEPEVYTTLAASYEGVLALHQLMQANEPPLIGGTDGAHGRPSLDLLHEMMRDPRYWRDRDPEFVSRVTAGFKQLYPD